ncbi:histone-lysine N-methyltransferase ATXR6-like [Salvia divinorum]|uniref:Histone-lysine N-methyltransferase ATXR6-like n=1 Tax=Salvia divinorum TaxID=28513 RepID=A0ABD1HDQ0_SALDI
MASLATALNSATSSLVLCATLERGRMHKTQTLNPCNCKNMMEEDEWPSLMVVMFDPREGFTVEADRCIRDLTIITEYNGDVDFLRNREHDDGDSMMTLLNASDTSKSLVICLVHQWNQKPWERLFYDYNGDENEYPTEHFI